MHALLDSAPIQRNVLYNRSPKQHCANLWSHPQHVIELTKNTGAAFALALPSIAGHVIWEVAIFTGDRAHALCSADARVLSAFPSFLARVGRAGICTMQAVRKHSCFLRMLAQAVKDAVRPRGTLTAGL